MTMLKPILEVRGLRKTFGAVVAANNVNIDVCSGEIIGIIGANGAGKTTFVNMVTGYLKPTAGSINFNGLELVGKLPREVTQNGISRSFQVSQVFSTMTVADNLLMALAISENRGSKAMRPMINPSLIEKSENILERYQMIQYRDLVVSALSQGVRKLLDIAMAVVSNPRILLLDEPTSGISVEEKFDFMDMVMNLLTEDKVTVLFIEHDMEIVERYVNRVIAFYQGEIIADMPPKKALIDPKVQEFVIGIRNITSGKKA